MTTLGLGQSIRRSVPVASQEALAYLGTHPFRGSGTLDGAEADFWITVGPSHHARHAIQAGMELSGQA